MWEEKDKGGEGRERRDDKKDWRDGVWEKGSKRQAQRDTRKTDLKERYSRRDKYV